MQGILKFVGPVMVVVVGIWIAQVLPNPVSLLKK